VTEVGQIRIANAEVREPAPHIRGEIRVRRRGYVAPLVFAGGGGGANVRLQCANTHHAYSPHLPRARSAVLYVIAEPPKPNDLLDLRRHARPPRNLSAASAARWGNNL